MRLNGGARAPQSNPSLAIESVTTATLPKWCEVMAQGFGDGFEFFTEQYLDWYSAALTAKAPLHLFLGLLNGEPVSTSAVFMAAGVAGIYNVATLPSARRQGLGAALTWAACERGRALGAQEVILHATQMGESVYRNLGFQAEFPISQFVYLPN
jgi:ribosomal protein S18 acetylase RimI-like enzyme